MLVRGHGRCRIVTCGLSCLVVGNRLRCHQPAENSTRTSRRLSSLSTGRLSKQRYSQTWSQYCQWCSQMRSSHWLPNDPEVASQRHALFAVYCFHYGWSRQQRGNSVTTIISKVSQASWYHRLHCGYNVKLLPQHVMAIQGMRRLRAAPGQKYPVTIEILRKLQHRLNFKLALHRVLWGLLSWAFSFS